MRSLAAALVAALLAAVPVQASSLDELAAGLRLSRLGAVAPPLALPRLADGRKVTLPELRGRPVIIYFWATW